MNKLYGIKNCDTVKKARKWLESQNIAFEFHDFREHGLDAATLANWLEALGTETLINRRSTTWKQLSESEREAVMAGEALAITLANPTLIKRPVLVTPSEVAVGFSDKRYAELLQG